ncbi:Thi20 phosphomethylpyrimidine kinase [Candida orthopsilosis Co 90-125]|uniref:Thi20 phosphomethylpyrimidine kinase n=1 Tax=Candida orthopsilosis (strain 90-125) TaxID=1136231 RepID=H8WXK3_CANO9|nr:Thi20 phosphomethylpyrimidine kinase [Candida orthopsilosis Co 90-125]CCG21509.1 Thi20 phosphomethylpyrimidine kinase [Candida orthopsilosis Co 90-125]
MKTEYLKINKPEARNVALPVVMTIAGSDSSGGAGIEADLKTFSTFGVYGATCITALTAQNTKGVKSIEKTPRKLLAEILNANLEDFYGYENAPLKVVKTGMLTKEAIEEIVKCDIKVKFVIDPVMVSTSGSQLFDLDGIKYCVECLMKDAYLITPNLPEAKALYGLFKSPYEITNVEEFKKFVVDLQSHLLCNNLLVKGGHIPFDKEGNVSKNGSQVIDILYESESQILTLYSSEYINSENTHGTGCTLASAIAANLTNGKSLTDSVTISIDFIHKGMLQMTKLGYGNGPLNHNLTPCTQVSHLIEVGGNEVLKFDDNNTFVDYLSSHPRVKQTWQKYVEHPFVKRLAENTLPFESFFYYLKQDYHYLIIYARMHGLLASKAPTYQQTHAAATIIGEIITEIEHHKKRLKAYNVDYERDIEELKPGKACVEYCDYLLNIGQKEDFLGIKVSLAPCLHGYAEAGAYGRKLRAENPVEIPDIYEGWLNEYASDWYSKADKEGRLALNALVVDGITRIRAEELVDIFNTVSQLEIAFWNEVLDI